MRHVPYSTFTAAIPVPPLRGRQPLSSRLGSGIVRLLMLPWRIGAIRRDLALLGAMSACELADIGLSRQDVCDAASMPLGQSPEPLLTQRAAERRRAELSRRR